MGPALMNSPLRIFCLNIPSIAGTLNLPLFPIVQIPRIMQPMFPESEVILALQAPILALILS
jgi:hypothetical protein